MGPVFPCSVVAKEQAFIPHLKVVVIAAGKLIDLSES
jgi:hypothetical protein